VVLFLGRGAILRYDYEGDRQTMTRLRIVFALAAVMALTFALPANAGAREKVGMIDFGTGVPVAGHISIDRGAESVDVNVHLRDLNAGHAFTVWAVIWNDPGECLTRPCSENDLGRLGTGNAVIFSGMGGVANGGGNLNANSTITSGDGPIPGEVTNLSGAEIHFVVQDHGMASANPDTLLLQTTTFEGGCGKGVPPTAPPDKCVDVQAAVFQP
jgi:hypothetical protein